MKGIQELNNENNKLSTQIEELKAEIHEIKNFLKFQFTNL
jgi:prefoldin subunit 5